MKVPRWVKRLIAVQLLLLLGAGIGFVGCYLLVAEYIVKDQFYAHEAQRCTETLWVLRSRDLAAESVSVEYRLLDLLRQMKRPLFGGPYDSVEVDSLSPERLAAFQFAKEYYERFGWRADMADPSSEDVKAYLEEVPWSAERQALNEWKAKFKGPVPQPAPPLSSVEWIDKPLPPQALQGKVTLLAFWGMRCGACVQAFPELQALQDAFGRKGLQVVAIHVQNVDRKKVVEFLESKGVSLPVGFGGGALCRSFMVRSLPSYFLLDRQGRLIHGPEHRIPSENRIRHQLGVPPKGKPETQRAVAEGIGKGDDGPPRCAEGRCAAECGTGPARGSVQCPPDATPSGRDRP